MRNWPRDRTFQPRKRTQIGDLYSGTCRILRVSPEVGALRPLLWIIFRHIAFRGLTRTRRGAAEGRTRRPDLVYADDVASLTSAESLATPRIEARRVVNLLRESFRDSGLAPDDAKTRNVLIGPFVPHHLICSRPYKLRYLLARVRLTARYGLEGTKDRTITDFDPLGDPIRPTRSPRDNFPCFQDMSARVLGVTLCDHFSAIVSATLAR